MRILTFGHIPTWAGGKQEHGLANVIYNLAIALSYETDAEVSLAASDVRGKVIKRDKLLIKGWNKSGLLLYAISHPVLFFSYLYYLVKNRNQFPPHETISGYLLKGIFLRKTIKEVNPDILHLHEASTWFYVKIVPKNVKIVVTFHGPYGISADIPYKDSYSILERNYLYSNRISEVLFISHSLLDEYKEYYKNIITSTDVILNAYNDTVFNFIEPISHEGIRICTIGTLQPRKGQLRVLEGLKDSGLSYSYYTIGAGSKEAEEELYSFSKAHGIKYTHLGKKKPEEIREVLSEMDYMILPSSSEGFGLVFLETIACGVKVILPKGLPIVQEETIIKPGINSILLEDYSSAAISKAIKELEGNYQYDHKMVSQSISACTWTQISKQYYNIFKKIIA